jgi:hypothetical protein
MAENEFGTLSAEEIKVVKEHRANQQKALGWYLGVDKCIQYINSNMNSDGTFKVDYRTMALEFERIQKSPRFY